MKKDKETTKPEFTWHKIDSELRTKKQFQPLKIQLKPSVNLTFKGAQKDGIQSRLHIDIQKSLQFQNSIGWNWHKSSNLPVFSLKLSIFNETQNNFITPPSLQAKIYAVKIVQNTFQKNENMYLEDLGIKGQSQIQLTQGCGHFNGLKFSSTSYNNEGAKFHLLIVIFSNEEQSDIPKNIICSVISPPIFVDSRKSARNYQEKKYLSFVELFHPDELEKFFAKRENKQMSEEKKIISNDGSGLYNYLTAPNIRHKVKHPLFLSVRFSSAFKVYFNLRCKYFLEKEATLSCVINRLQKKLIREVGMLRRSKHQQVPDEREFAIALTFESTIEKQKTLEMLEYLDCRTICLIDTNQILENQFVNISQLGDLIQAYKSEYISLRKKSQRQISQLKVKRVKNQTEQYEKHHQFQEKGNSLFDKIIQKEEDKFSMSHMSYNEKEKLCHQEQKKEEISYSIPVQGQSLKKIKLNENSFFEKNQNFLRYPLHENLEQRFVQQRFQLQRYQYNPMILNDAHQGQLVKKEEDYVITFVSRQQVLVKIKQMCLQVYQRNKKSILHHLETLKKSNIKWKVKDVEQFIFSYSSALMDAIHFRQRLLHHMFLENQILKAKVGVIKQMALTDLDNIKGNIMSMNRYLPESFIIDKLKQNSLWKEQAHKDGHFQTLKVAQVKEIGSSPSPKSQNINEKGCSKNHRCGEKVMIEEASSSEIEGQIECDCDFVSNVFELESPSVQQ